MYNPYSLEGKTILITGASSGIGRATAIECSKLGAKCVLTARNEERLQATLAAMEGEGHSVIVADLTNSEDLERLVTEVPELDGVVNNAGLALTKLITFTKESDLEKMFKINTFAPVMLIKWLLKKKKVNKNASIVVTSSVASMSYAPGNTIYGMTKSAIASFTKYCSLEMFEKNIRVNSIHPGMVDTEMTRNLSFSNEEIEADKAKYFGKRYAEPYEIAWAIVYLLSDAAAWVTGSELVIDGGIHLK